MNGRAQHAARSIAISIAGIMFGFVVGGLVVALQGKPVGASLSALVEGSFGSVFAVGNTLNKAAALLFVACGYIYAAKGGLVSIGSEGQLHVGGMIGVAGALATKSLPQPLPLICALSIGFVGGGLWGAIAGWLRAKRGVNIVISTLLLNYIGLRLVELAVDQKSLLRSGDAEPQSAEVPGAARLARLLPDTTSALHLGFVLAVVTAVAVWFIIGRTVPGFRLRMLGHNPAMAARSGISVDRMSVKVMFVSGGLAGLAGCSLLLGEQFRVRPDFALGFGFAGIAVALIARSNVLASIAASILFGAILAGGNLLEAKVQVPNALVSVIQGSIILAAAATAFLLKRPVPVISDDDPTVPTPPVSTVTVASTIS
jgi:general nucleoside transport system permease protein